MCRRASRPRPASRTSRKCRRSWPLPGALLPRCKRVNLMKSLHFVNVDHPVFGVRDPDARGYFGEYGGRFVPETLVAPIEELTRGYLAARADSSFADELSSLLRHYVGRPTPLYEARRLAAEARGPASA